MTREHEPGTRPLRSRPYDWRELTTLVLHHRRELILANLIAVLGTLVSVPVPLLMPLLVDEVLLNKPGALVGAMSQIFPAAWHGPVLYILAILLVTVTLRLTGTALGVLQTREFTRISKDVIFRLRRDLLDRLRRVSMSEYETLGSGTVASHLVTDLDTIDRFVGGATSKFLVAVLSICGTAVVLLWMNWQLGLFIILLNPLVIYVTTLFGRKVSELKKREITAYQAFQESLAETLDAIAQIRAGNRERFYIERIIDHAREMRDFASAFTWKSDAGNRLSFNLLMFGFDCFRAMAMLMVLFSDLSIGEMLAVFAYLWFMMGPVQEVLGIQYAYHAAEAALARINRLLAMELEPQYPHRQDPFAGKRTLSITLEDIRFRYGDGPLVLDGISLAIAAGERVAFVGASGGGKTTLVQVILGLYPPSSGVVRFDGVPVDLIGMDVVRDHVATVLQQPALFNDSVRMNLTLGREVADERLWQALEVAQLRQAVEGLDQGLDTRLGRDGIRLSGGECQRLAQTRARLLRPAAIPEQRGERFTGTRHTGAKSQVRQQATEFSGIKAYQVIGRFAAHLERAEYSNLYSHHGASSLSPAAGTASTPHARSTDLFPHPGLRFTEFLRCLGACLTPSGRRCVPRSPVSDSCASSTREKQAMKYRDASLVDLQSVRPQRSWLAALADVNAIDAK
ncbi:MAG: ABC transporter ATP-binding protein [Bdellovibrio bacteriovorus]